MNEPVLPLPGPSLLASKSLTTFGVGPLAPDGGLQHGTQESGRPIFAHHKLWGALP